MRKINALACGIVLSASGLAMAQVTETRTVSPPIPAGTRTVNQIIGSSIRLQGGTSYGRVEDIVLNDDGYVEYLVVSREGSYAMLPWSAAKVDYGQRVVTYDVDPQVVQPLFFTRDAWPNYSDPQFTTRIRSAFPRAVRREVRRIEREGGTVVPPGAVVTPPGTVVVPAPR
jgi:sporulation protein YlmC with PRC-barrel domain